MYTLEYKPGYYIHGYFDKPTCSISVFKGWHAGGVHCRSAHAAKCWITRFINRKA